MNIERMNIIHIASKLAPIAKVGGVGDVVSGLAKDSIHQGHQVEIILPKYNYIDEKPLKNLKVAHQIWSSDSSNTYLNTIWSATLENLKVLLLESHHPNDFYNRGKIYGCSDDIDRFIYFSKDVLNFLF